MKKEPKNFYQSGLSLSGKAEAKRSKSFLLLFFKKEGLSSSFKAPGVFPAVGWFTSIVLYVLIWWTLLFAILPLGTVPVETPDSVTGWRGAPERPHLLRKLLLTTLVSAVIWGACAIVIDGPWLSFRHGLLSLPDN